MYRVTMIQRAVDFLSETMKVRKCGNYFLNTDTNCHCTILYSVKIFFRKEGAMKILSN